MAVLVVGGAGFLGSTLDKVLLDRGHDVAILDNFSGGRIEFIQQILNQVSSVRRADIFHEGADLPSHFGSDIETVFHLAANRDVWRGLNEPKIDLEQNTIGTSNVLEAMRKKDIGKIVFTSSCSVYGNASKRPTPETHPTHPISLYGASKLACEALISAYCGLYGFKGWIFRMSNTCGRNQRKGLQWHLLTQYKTEGKFHVFNDGQQTRSFIHVSDCAEAIVHVWQTVDPRYEIYNLASEDSITVNEVTDITEEELGKPHRGIPRIMGEPTWKGDIRHMWLDISKIKSTGWKPRYSSREAVKLTVNEIRGELGL